MPSTLCAAGHSADAGPPDSGIDLPVKALTWQDADGAVWLTYNDAAYRAERHQLAAASEPAVAAIEAGRAHLVAQAVQQPSST